MCTEVSVRIQLTGLLRLTVPVQYLHVHCLVTNTGLFCTQVYSTNIILCDAVTKHYECEWVMTDVISCFPPVIL